MPTEVDGSNKTASVAAANDDDDVIALLSSDEEGGDVYEPPVDGQPITSGDCNLDAEQAMIYHRAINSDVIDPSRSVVVRSTNTASTTSTSPPQRKKQKKSRPIPPCPPKPSKDDKPNAPRGWNVISLSKPQCVDNEEGELEWVFFYYTNKKTGETRWTPPPPSGAIRGGEDTTNVGEKKKKRKDITSMMSFVVKPPSKKSYAKELRGEEMEGESEDTPRLEDVELEEKTVGQSTFTGDLPTKLYMKPKEGQESFPEKARAIGIDPTGKTRQQLTKLVRLYWIQQHGDDVQSYLTSDCFKGARQDIDRTRKERPNAKRKREFAKKAAAAGKMKDDKMRSHRASMPVADALQQFGHRGVTDTEDGLRCDCNGGSMKGWDRARIIRHLNDTKVHADWEAKREKEGVQQAYLDHFQEEEDADEASRTKLAGTRKSNLLPADKKFGKETVKQFFTNGIPLNKLKKSGTLRLWLSRISNKKLQSRECLTEYIPTLLEEEENLQRMTLRDKKVSTIFDGTPRQGELFAQLTPHINVNSETRRVEAVHTLIHVSALKGSLNHDSLNAEVNLGLANRQIMHSNVTAAMMDRCSTNSAALNESNAVAKSVGDLEWLVSFCMSHLACNAGNVAGFPLLTLVWGLLQKIFSQSTAAQDIFLDVTGMSWPTHSETRWFSKYDVLEKLLKVFPDLLTVMTNIVRKKLSPSNSAKLLNLLLDTAKNIQLKIELAAYVDGLYELRNLCYYLETDATDVAMKCAKRIDAFLNMFPNGSMKSLPSANRLIMEAIDWATKPIEEGGGGYNADAAAVWAEMAPEHESGFNGTTVAQVEAQVNAEVPRRPRRVASAGVAAATRTLESAQQTRQREEDERRAAAEEAAAEAQAEAEREASRLAALEKVVESQAKRPPLTKKEWEAHIYSGVCGVFEYFFERIGSGGDREVIVEFFRGARIFDPSYAKNLTRAQAFQLIDKLAHYPIFNMGGENSIISRLKKGWNGYHKNACGVVADFGKCNNGKEDSAAIATWHYRLSLRIEGEKADDSCCRYCPSKRKACACYDGLKVWWEACELAALVLPSSGSSERVFSFSKSLFGDQQSQLLSDSLILGLMLAFNKRA